MREEDNCLPARSLPSCGKRTFVLLEKKFPRSPMHRIYICFFCSTTFRNNYYLWLPYWITLNHCVSLCLETFNSMENGGEESEDLFPGSSGHLCKPPYRNAKNIFFTLVIVYCSLPVVGVRFPHRRWIRPVRRGKWLGFWIWRWNRPHWLFQFLRWYGNWKWFHNNYTTSLLPGWRTQFAI